MAKRLTLTFDNGPEPEVTPQVVAELGRRGLTATFFVVGRRLDDDTLPIVADVVAAGHPVGNHTFSHPRPFGGLPGPDAVAEIVDTSALLGDLEAPERFFRPSAGGGVLAPGLLNDDAVAHLEAEGYSLVLWNAICEDWSRPDGSWIDVALAEIERHDWTLLVLHDIAGGGMDHLPRFLDEVEARGIEVVAEMPPDLVPIVRGTPVGSVDDLVA